LKDDGGLKSSSQPKVVDARDVPSEDTIAVLIADREYRLADLVTRPEKKIGPVGLHLTPKESSSSAEVSAADWSDSSRVTAKRSRSSNHSRTFRSRQSCEPIAAAIFPPVGPPASTRAAALQDMSCSSWPDGTRRFPLQGSQSLHGPTPIYRDVS
jgi:hypothetical protein